jgi:hypothetical protein
MVQISDSPQESTIKVNFSKLEIIGPRSQATSVSQSVNALILRFR